MAVSIDWATGVISIPRADMTLIQSSPNEIRELNTDEFRLELKALEASFYGMAYPITHIHNPPLSVGGIELARVIEIINNYTVTFEDGQYSVNLVGSNSNIADVVNPNQVSIRSGNSAGLVTSSAIEQTEFQERVWIDEINGVTGSTYPKGTPRQPVNNLADAYVISQARGLKRIHFIGNCNFGANDNYSNLEFEGDGISSLITFSSGAKLYNCEFFNTQITGAMSGAVYFFNCAIANFTLEGDGSNPSRGIILKDSLLLGTFTLAANYTGQIRILDCWSDVAGAATPIIDFNNGSSNMINRNWSGGIELRNLTQGLSHSIDFASGQAIIDSSCTSANIVIRGVGKLINNAGAGVTIDDVGLMNKVTVADAVWDTEVSTFNGNTMGSQIRHIPKTVGVPYWVSVNGSDSNTGASPQSPFRTINRALSLMDDSDILNLESGIYNENVVINNSIHIHGENGAEIHGLSGAPTVCVKARDAMLDNVTIEVPDGEVGVQIENKHFMMSHCHVHGGNIGIYIIEGADNNMVMDCHISEGQTYASVEIKGDENVFTMCVLNGSGITQEGFDIEGTASYNVFRNCDVLGFTQYDIHYYLNTIGNLFYGRTKVTVDDGTDNKIIKLATKADVINASQL